MTISLRHCVREAQHGNHEAVLFLLREFEPLIRPRLTMYSAKSWQLYTTPLNMKAIGNNVIGNASRKTSSNRISSPIFPIIGLRRKKQHRNTAC